MATTTAPALTATELAEIDAANETGRTPVAFVHGLWLLSSSWRRWRELFEANGYATIAPGWPDEPLSIEEVRANPAVFAKKTVQQVTDHSAAAIARLAKRPVVIGHSFGGLIAQKLAGEGLAVATVAIDNAPFKGVLPLPASSLKSVSPVLTNPANIGRAVTLTFDQFRYGWANNLPEDEARALYDTYHVPAPGRPLFEAATANVNPFATQTAVNSSNPDRGPLLIIAGAEDHTAPLAITRATYRLQSRNPGITEIAEIPGRGHSLVIDHGWREVAEVALAFVRRFA